MAYRTRILRCVIFLFTPTSVRFFDFYFFTGLHKYWCFLYTQYLPSSFRIYLPFSLWVSLSWGKVTHNTSKFHFLSRSHVLLTPVPTVHLCPSCTAAVRPLVILDPSLAYISIPCPSAIALLSSSLEVGTQSSTSVLYISFPIWLSLMWIISAVS